MRSGPNGFAAGAAAILTRVLLLLYPPSFRKDVGDALVADVRRRAADLSASPVRIGFWLMRHTSSLVGNALAAWVEKLPVPGASWLDVKLAARMLVRQPGLSLVAVFALAIGIPVGLLPLHVLDSLSRPLPVDGGDRIVMVRNYDKAASSPVTRPLHDFTQWRAELSSFADLALWREDLYNVLSDDGRGDPIRGAEVTPSFFSLLRIPPYLGRPLNAADEVVGAPDVVVIGHQLWLSRMGGAPDVIGKTVRIGGTAHTVVGVMPEGFLFPFRDHLWLPLRYNPLESTPGAGPSGRIMGRLAAGVSIEQARGEIEFLGQRMAGQFPQTHAQLQPQVLPYTSALTEIDSPEAKLGILVTQTLAVLLLALACANVGILILARAATRSAELAIRTALGASRARIVSQLFIESLLLAVRGRRRRPAHAAGGRQRSRRTARRPSFLGRLRRLDQDDGARAVAGDRQRRDRGRLAGAQSDGQGCAGHDSTRVQRQLRHPVRQGLQRVDRRRSRDRCVVPDTRIVVAAVRGLETRRPWHSDRSVPVCGPPDSAGGRGDGRRNIGPARVRPPRRRRAPGTGASIVGGAGRGAGRHRERAARHVVPRQPSTFRSKDCLAPLARRRRRIL